MLHPQIFELVAAAKGAGLSTSMVTNGSCLTPSALLRLAGRLDWLALSVDASSDELHTAIGRGVQGELAGGGAGGRAGEGCSPSGAGGSRHLQRVLGLWDLARQLGFPLKLNTVVTRATL